MIPIVVHWLQRGGGFLFAAFLANSNERHVHPYTLPVIRARSVAEWEEERVHVLKLFESEVYGAIPKEKPNMSAKVLEEGVVFDGKALRRQVCLTLSRAGRSITLQLLTYTPVRNPGFEQGRGGYPTVLAYNLEGNHTIHTDPGIIPSKVYAKRLPGVLKRLSWRDRGRKMKKEHLPVERLVEKGFAVATLYYGDVDPDYDDGFENGAHALYPELPNGSWGSISAWSWGLLQVMNHLGQHLDVDQGRVSLFGFSRLGKAALWAAANDERFSAVIADSPGKGGASLARRNFGESIWLMTLRFPHWFIKKYKTYAGREQELPVDQHQLLALIAPRPILVSSADKDWWSDPAGEKEAVKAAQAAYHLYGSDKLRHMLHKGKHAVTEDEWEDYLQLLKKT